jgi:type IV secretory pathway TraG/TraD family ATPase VirD4
MAQNNNSGSPGMSDQDALRLLAVVVGSVVAFVLAVEWVVFAWGLLNLDVRLLPVGDVIGGAFALAVQVGRREHLDATVAFRTVPGVMPPRAVAIVLVVLAVAGVAAAVAGGLLRVDRWRSRSQLGGSALSPKGKVRARPWAKPRDLLHLQPRVKSRSGMFRRASNRLMRLVLWERAAPAPAGADSWNLGRIRGAELRSGREKHALVIAPTGAGKSLRVAAPAVVEHMGGQVVVTTKMDLVAHTALLRGRLGLPWAVIAPFNDLSRFGIDGACWSPLPVCRDWSEAMETARALHDADPAASAVASGAGSDGARFYNTDAIELLVAPLLHAAALSDRSMTEVRGWMRAGVGELDEPRELLEGHGAWEAERALLGVQEMDGRQRGFLLSSAAQLLSAYAHPAVQAIDRPGLDVAELMRQRGTLYIVAKESKQAQMAPLIGALLGEVLRSREELAHTIPDPRTVPLVKIVVDEAASLTPLGDLPRHLAVTRSSGIRWMLVYQSVAQIRARYGVEADTILANAGVKLHLGPIHDRATRTELLDLLGEEPVTRTSHTSRGWGAEESVTRAEEHRPKLSTDDLARLGEGKAVLVHGRDVPAIVELPFWWSWHGRARSAEEAIEWEEGERL